MNTPPVRTMGHAVMEGHVAVEYAELHEKLWSHLDTLVSWLQIAGGTIALLGVAMPDGWKWLTPTAGVALAVLAGIQLALKPRERSISFRDTRRELELLISVAGDLSHSDLERNLAKILSAAPRGFEALTTAAQNRALVRHGYPPDPLHGLGAFLARCAA